MSNEKYLTLTILEAAKILGISRNLAYELAREGTIPSLKLGSRRILVPQNALEKMLSEGGHSA